MTQKDFDEELASGKRSWVASCIDGDLDIADREINGDLDICGLTVKGDLDLSGTVIHGSLSMQVVQVMGDIDMSNLRVDKEIEGGIPHHCSDGEIITTGLTVNGKFSRIPNKGRKVLAKRRGEDVD